MDFNSRLIGEVYAREILYNYYHHLHKNKDAVREEWKRVGAAMRSTVEACKRRWNTLRTKYGKERRRMMMLPSESIVSSGSNWPFYQRMNFLDPYIKHRRQSIEFSPETLTEGQVVEDVEVGAQPHEESDFTSESLVSSVSTPSGSTCGKRKIPETNQLQREDIKFFKLSPERFNNDHMDKFDHFANFIAAHLRGKNKKEADFYIKAVTDALFSPVTAELFEEGVE